MVRLKSGDKVACRIKEGTIVVAYREYDEVKHFEIVAVDDAGYYLYVPPYYSIKNTIPIDKYRLKKIGIDARFLDADMVHIDENMICQVVQRLDGMFCCICQEFLPMAEANQEDGTLVCWSCRQNPYR